MNDVTLRTQPNGARQAMTRADGEIPEVTETFTFNGMLYFSDWQNTNQSCKTVLGTWYLKNAQSRK